MVVANLIIWIYVRASPFHFRCEDLGHGSADTGHSQISLRSVTISFTLAAMSILGSQMLLNMRLEATRQVVFGTHFSAAVGQMNAEHLGTTESIPLQFVEHGEAHTLSA